jgi:hypothetical protein
MWNPFDITHRPSTDLSRWRLLVSDGGRHTWHYLRTEEELANWPQNEVDKFWLGVETVHIISYPHELPNLLILTGHPKISAGGGCSSCST